MSTEGSVGSALDHANYVLSYHLHAAGQPVSPGDWPWSLVVTLDIVEWSIDRLTRLNRSQVRALRGLERQRVVDVRRLVVGGEVI